MLKVGLTGGIGSGKSTVARILEGLGIPVYYADVEAKRIMDESQPLRESLIRHFGQEVFAGGQLNRSYLAGIVFQDKEKLELLNSLVHPETLRDADEWLEKQSSPYAVKEAALIFESGAQEHLDYVIGVTAPQALRIQRTMHRDGVSREEVLARMKRQLDDSMKMKLCDFVLHNDEQQPLLPQVLALHETLKSLAGPTE